MKKLLALSVILSVVGLPAVFADVSISGKFDATVIPLQVIMGERSKAVPGEDREENDDTIIGAGLGRNGSGDSPRARIGVVAQDDSGKVGLNFMLQFNHNSGFRVAFDDFAEVWWKPIEWLKFDVGRFNIDTLRGKIGDDGWQHYTVRMKSADEIFTRFQGQSVDKGDGRGGGFAISLTPIEGLFIGVGVPGLIRFTSSASDHTDFIKEKAEYAYSFTQAAVGFEIGGIGLVRAQFVGAKPAVSTSGDYWSGYNFTAPKIEVAFAFTGMEGLVIDLGAKIPLAFDEYDDATGLENKRDSGVLTPDFGAPITTGNVHKGTTYQAPIQVSLGAGFTTGGLNISGRIDTKFAGSAKTGKDYNASGKDVTVNLPFILNAHLWPSYDLGFATLGIDFGLEYIGETKSDYDAANDTQFKDTNGGIRIGFGAWLKKSIGSSSIRGGIAYRLAGEIDKQKEPGTLTIPIIFDYSF